MKEVYVLAVESSAPIPLEELRPAFESEDVDLQVRLVQESGAIAAALAEAEALVARARTALEAFPAGTERSALDALAAYVTTRDR